MREVCFKVYLNPWSNEECKNFAEKLLSLMMKGMAMEV